MRASGAFICVWRGKYQLVPAHKTCRLSTDEVEELFDAGLLEVRKLLPWQLELVKHHRLKVVAALFVVEKPSSTGIRRDVTEPKRRSGGRKSSGGTGKST